MALHPFPRTCLMASNVPPLIPDIRKTRSWQRLLPLPCPLTAHRVTGAPVVQLIKFQALSPLPRAVGRPMALGHGR